MVKKNKMLAALKAEEKRLKKRPSPGRATKNGRHAHIMCTKSSCTCSHFILTLTMGIKTHSHKDIDLNVAIENSILVYSWTTNPTVEHGFYRNLSPPT